MGSLVKQWIPASIATLVCLLVLFTGLRNTLIEWAVIVAAFAFFLGLLNVGRVHVKKALQSDGGRLHSIVLLLAAMFGLVLTFASLLPGSPAAVRTASQSMFNYFISPVGAALAALMAVTLTLAAFRMLQVRRDWKAWLFVLVTVFALASSIPLAGIGWTRIADLREFVVDVVGMSGMRGLLLGVVLGTVATAMRTLLWPRGDS